MTKMRVTRSMMPRQIKFTKEGYEKVLKDITVLEEKRKAAVIALRTAREMGDLSENGAYKAARFQLSDIDRELRRLRFQVRFGEIVEIVKNGTVNFGSTVTLQDGTTTMTFLVVDGYESNPQERKLSMYSPIGKAVIGKRKNDRVQVIAPAGIKEYTIIEVA